MNQPPRAVVLFFHGYGSYGGKYGFVAKHWAEQGFDFVTYDYCGFGKSDGMPGYIDSQQSLIDDAFNFVQKAREFYGPDVKFFALGLSMGGAISLTLSRYDPSIFVGLLLVAPFIRMARVPPGTFLLKCLACLCPRWALISVGEPSERYKPMYMDPQVYKGKSRLGTLNVLMGLANLVNRNMT